MRVFRRSRENSGDPAATDFMWGVPRREGHSDTDDPAVHSGLVQHAFEFGRDDRAICGFEPPKRASLAYRDARPQLAVPGRDNPKCRKCELLVISRVRTDEAVPVLHPTARDGRYAGTGDVEPALEGSHEAVDPTDEQNEPQTTMVGGHEIGGTSAAGEEQVDEERAADEQSEGAQTSSEMQATAEPETADEPRTADEASAEEASAEEQTVDVDEGANDVGQVAGASRPEPDESPDAQGALDVDSLGGIRDPGFQPRAQAERARRRSVRKGGTVIVGPGRRSAVIAVPLSTEVAGIVANVEPEIQDVRVEAVTVGNDGTARVTLNRPASDAVEVAWYIVSNPFRESA